LQALQKTLTELAAPPTQNPQTAASAASMQALIPDLRILQKLLAQTDLQALDVFNAIRSRNPGQEETLQGIELPLKAFDFGKAVVQCDELIRRAGATH
jgi:hypothetical protein